jgi:hypothetical protein
MRPASVLAFTLLLAACRSLEVEIVQVAIISVPTELTEQGYESKPFASFIEGSGIGLSSTVVGQEGCVVRATTAVPGSPGFDNIDGGPGITVRFSGPEATLTKRIVDSREIYALPEGVSMAFTPGEQITVTTPGAVDGFPARQLIARTAEAFTAAPITLPTSTTDDLTVTWTPVPDVSGSAMFYSIRYSSPGISDEREIACVFRDDGTGLIGSTMLTEFRLSSVRHAIAQRARVTASRAGSAIIHVTSTFEVPVTLTDVP